MTESTTVRRALAQSGLVPIDAHVLLAHVLQRGRAWLVAHADDALHAEQATAFLALARRRRDGEPIAYLTGLREFWGMPLTVSPAVLIPRPETETLVEVALALLAADRLTRVLDLGTGSGAVALALARELPRATIVATDVSAVALEVARTNAHRLGVANVTWLASDWYAGLGADQRFDVIASNPPYVDADDPHMAVGDLRYEPVGALTAGADALLALRRVIVGAVPFLAPGGSVAVEHGYDQAETVRTLFGDAGFTEIRTTRDIAGVPRVTSGRKAPA
ncbi:MAG: peptide chain release factor N(5)-glutamine methyltransferase [Casimicrobiaceae bacterium]